MFKFPKLPAMFHTTISLSCLGCTRNKRLWHLLALMALFGGAGLLHSGCAHFDMRRNIPWKEAAEKPVQSVVVFWTDALIERRSGPPYRGFGGRVYFYPADMSRPVKVRGTMIVYAFDDNLPPPENLKPVRKFVFTSEQLEKVYADSKLGPSYNILIPWDEFSPNSQRISLIVRYIPENGPSVVSEQARVFLPGLESSLLTDGGKHQTQPMSSGSRAATTQNRSPEAIPTVAVTTDNPELTLASLASDSGPTWRSSDQPRDRLPVPGSGETTDDSGTSRRRKMETLTLNITPRAAPSAQGQQHIEKEPALTGQETLRARLTQSTASEFLPLHQQGRATSFTETTGANPSRGAISPTPSMAPQYPGWSPIGSPLQYTPATAPPTAGQLIGQMNQQPPVHSEPYRLPAPAGANAPAPVDR